MARIGFGLAAAGSFVFAAWQLKNGMVLPGLSFAVAFVGMHLLLTVFGFFKSTWKLLPNEARNAGWAAFAVSAFALRYISINFKDWIPFSILWMSTQIPLFVCLILSIRSPSTDESQTA